MQWTSTEGTLVAKKHVNAITAELLGIFQRTAANQKESSKNEGKSPPGKKAEKTKHERRIFRNPFKKNAGRLEWGSTNKPTRNYSPPNTSTINRFNPQINWLNARVTSGAENIPLKEYTIRRKSYKIKKASRREKKKKLREKQEDFVLKTHNSDNESDDEDYIGKPSIPPQTVSRNPTNVVTKWVRKPVILPSQPINSRSTIRAWLTQDMKSVLGKTRTQRSPEQGRSKRLNQRLTPPPKEDSSDQEPSRISNQEPSRITIPEQDEEMKEAEADDERSSNEEMRNADDEQSSDILDTAETIGRQTIIRKILQELAALPRNITTKKQQTRGDRQTLNH
ncbi:hypothetical protein DFH11DRAFT_1539810 [Phellopilus nigrolimitatus]|nr:hypothetical protein DFH11DRAFT_1539810 [Phellopilus nigrolimitatus]